MKHPSPHEPAHNAASEWQWELSIETVRIIPGQRSTAITEVYAEKHQREAIAPIMEMG